MRFCLLFFLLLFGLLCFSQSNKVNQFDSNGLKHGYWIENDSLEVASTVELNQVYDITSKKVSDNQININNTCEIITHKGYYYHGNKNGIWKLFKKGNLLWMKILYDYGNRINIKVFYPNGRLFLHATKQNNNLFLIKEYSPKGIELNTKTLEENAVNLIDEKKLFTIRY